MSQENVELVRGMFAAWNEHRPADSNALFDEHVVWDARNVAAPDVREVYYGLEAVREYWRAWLPAWQDIRVEVDWIEGRGDRVICWVRGIYVGKGSGAPIDLSNGWDLSFRDGKIIRVSFFVNEREALYAVGLRE
jgi:ketosteroid isomerase-like protein